jgi:hypothetical protein
VRSSALSLFTRAQSTSLTPMRCLSFLLNGKNARTSQSYLRLFYLICPADNGLSTGWAGWATAHLRLREKIFRVVFSAHRRTLTHRSRAPKLLLHAASRASFRPAPCSCSVASAPPGWPSLVPTCALLSRLDASWLAASRAALRPARPP